MFLHSSMAKHKVDFFELVSGIFLLLLLILTILISFQGDYSLFIVVLGFLPIIVLVLLSLYIHEFYADHQGWIWLLPIFINGIFYAIASTSPSLSEQLEVNLLLGANMVLSIIYIIIVSAIFLDDIVPKAKTPSKPKQITPQTLQEYIHSIEDKSKALNFVIGRVYSKYRGGSRALREILKIPSEWYNEFSLLGVGTESIDKEKLIELVNRFEKHLAQFEKKEKDVLLYESKNLKNLIRDPNGEDKIIDVMDKNDKDPVQSYYEGAVRFCKQIKEEVQKGTLKLVENSYIPKEDELEENQPSKKDSSSKKKNPSHP